MAKTKKTKRDNRTKAELLQRAQELLQQHYQDDEDVRENLLPLDRCYKTKGNKSLSSYWYSILERVDGRRQELKYLQDVSLPTLELGSEALLTTGDPGGWGDQYILSGKILVGVLDKMRKELGPNPTEALVLVTDDDVCVTSIQPTSKETLQKIVQRFEKWVDREAAKQKQQQKQQQQKKVRQEIDRLIHKLGPEKVLQLLKEE